VLPFLVWCHNPINQGVTLIPNSLLWIKQSMVLCLHIETISSKGLVNCCHYWVVPKKSINVFFINNNLTNYVVNSNPMIVIVFIEWSYRFRHGKMCAIYNTSNIWKVIKAFEPRHNYCHASTWRLKDSFLKNDITTDYDLLNNHIYYSRYSHYTLII